MAVGRNRQRLDDGQEHTAGPGGGAGHRRRDNDLADDQPIGQPERVRPQPLDEAGGDPVPQPGLHEPTREEEGYDDEPYDLVGEADEGGGEGERLGEYGDGEAEEGPRADREWAEDEACDGGEEN